VPRPRILDLAAVAVCTLVWGTTWFAITFQLGRVDPVVSLVYRFALAAVLLILWCRVRSLPLRLTRVQHLAACGVGFFTFTIDYLFIYLAEARVASAVVAVMFSTLALVNLAAFRIAFGQRAPLRAWTAAALGTAGAAVGNVFARRGETAGASVAGITTWSIAYGAVMLSLFALLSGRQWEFESTLAYVASLIYLAIFGSVIAFLFYYGLARRRGYATAAYITALTPPVAMLMSTLFEGKTWTATAISGLVLVVLGQWLLLRTRRA
jgi:drug/metabolite transporter (DMT)-like permease